MEHRNARQVLKGVFPDRGHRMCTQQIFQAIRIAGCISPRDDRSPAGGGKLVNSVRCSGLRKP